MRTFIFTALSLILMLGLSRSGHAQETSGSFTEGSILIGYDSRACDSTLAGSLRYSSGAGGSFTPADLTDLVGWWDPDQNVTTGTGGVTQWAPAAGAGTFSQGTSGQRPDMSTYNSHVAIDFEHNRDDVLATGNVSYGIGTGDFYVAAFVLPESLNDAGFFTLGAPTDDVNMPAFGGTGAPFFWKGGGSNFTYNSLALSAGTPQIIEIWREGTSVRMRINNVLDTDSRTTSNNIGTTDEIVLATYTTDGGGFTYDGLVGDVVFAGATTNQERDDTLAYLNAKWGVGLSLGGSACPIEFCDGAAWQPWCGN